MNNEQPTQPTAGAMRALHTPTPWHIGKTGQKLQSQAQPLAIYQKASANLIAAIFGDVRGGEPVAEANAELIVRAVNSYEQAQADKAELIEIARELISWPEDVHPSVIEELQCKARAVLARHAK
jgi:hypothetical protein